MIILPDRNISRSKFLMPIHKKYWQTTSQSQLKDEFGNENKTRFRVRARLNDGFTKWTGWFDDREDFDAFLWALQTDTLKYERSLWSLPEVSWSPDIGEMLSYDFASVTFLTSPVDTLSTTWTVPNDWSNNKNTIECVGAGGGGGAQRYNTNPKATGGGGGGYGKYTNMSLTIGSTPQWQISSGGTGGTAQPLSLTPARSAGNTWFNAATYETANVGSTGGKGGSATYGNSSLSAVAGGIGKGTLSYTGGSAGSCSTTTSYLATGGGGAAGMYGNGNNSNNATSSIKTAGGSGDAGYGGAGGLGYPTTPGDNGYGGNEWGSYGGSGGGGGSGTMGGLGGGYGGGGGGACDTGTLDKVLGADGYQGIIVITYTPKPAAGFNMPHQGM